MLWNVSVAPNRNKLLHYVHFAGTGCTHLLALYWLMVFIHEKHVMPSSGKVKTKQEQITTLRGTGTGCTHLLALYWLMVFIHETHVLPSSGKVKIKSNCSHTWLFQVVSAAQCVSCSKQEQIYHITYIWLVLVAPIFWHYIDWWCLFMKHMWCHLVAKKKLKGICSHTWLFQAVSAAQCVSCSKQEQITTLRTFGW